MTESADQFFLGLAAKLAQAGVSVKDHVRVFEALSTDPRLSLVLLTLPGEPRAGDVLTKPEADPFRVELAVPAGIGRYCVVGVGVPESRSIADIYAERRAVVRGS